MSVLTGPPTQAVEGSLAPEGGSSSVGRMKKGKHRVRTKWRACAGRCSPFTIKERDGSLCILSHPVTDQETSVEL